MLATRNRLRTQHGNIPCILGWASPVHSRYAGRSLFCGPSGKAAASDRASSWSKELERLKGVRAVLNLGIKFRA